MMKLNRKLFSKCLFGSLLFLSLFFSCDTPFGGKWEYKFINSTQYSISITLNNEYYTSSDSTYASSSSLYLYSNSSKTVYVKSGSVDFQWTASSYNSKIFSTVDGSTVTFKER
jgi:hypothetical protein